MKVDVTVTVEHTALETLTEADVRRFLVAQGRNMVTQARKNIVGWGGKSGKWPPLSKAYEKRKKDGGTPGAGKNRYAMLRDTGALYEGLTSVVDVNGMGVASVSLDADGVSGGRPTNSELLLIHAEGRGRVPVRNPAADMSLFEKRFAEELDRFLFEKTGAVGRQTRA